MIKLVASDLDGTLLPEGTKDINPEFYDVVRKLHEKGIIFVAASGRDLSTMRTVVEPIGDIIYCISNNGGRITKYMDSDLAVYSLDFNLVQDVISDTRNDEHVKFVSLSTNNGTYTDYKDKETLDWLLNGYGMNPILVNDMSEKELSVVKISVLTTCDATDVVDYYEKKYGEMCHVTVAGDRWIDFTHVKADKGIAFLDLINKLGISKMETWAFGDNINDISMLEAAGVGYAAPSAREEVKNVADVCLEGNIWDSVINQLKTLL